MKTAVEPDFHGLLTVIFDGTMLTMPDTAAKSAEFGKPKSGRAAAAFPQVRVMALLAPTARLVLELACGPCLGAGTGERALMLAIVGKLRRRGLLMLLDAGFYSFDLLFSLSGQGHFFLLKVPSQVKLKPLPGSAYGDGSYLAEISKKVDGEWRTLRVRVVEGRLKGFRPFRLLTNLRDEKITARELVRHYHQRWEIEIAYDEIKTEQAATLRGQTPTVLRSKRPDLVRQEL